MRFALGLVLVTAPVFAVQMTISPAVITQCVGETGQATITWRDAGQGPVQVRLGSASGPSLTGWEPAAGQAETGLWVPAGMIFVLVDTGGLELARVVAEVRCGAVTDPPGNSSYWPLAPGNQWVYRYSSRVVTSAYEHWRIGENVSRNGRVYAVLERSGGSWLLREDDRGRIWRLLASGDEQLWFDPGPVPDPSAFQRAVGRGPVSTPIGNFADGVNYQSSPTLQFETGSYARGIGLVSSSSSLVAGSSGGFYEGYQLVEARVNGRLWTTSATRLVLAAESLNPDVTGRHVTNCAVPCYFVACGLVPGADSPGTYKPCMQARVGAEKAPAGAEALLELLNAQGAVLSSQALPVAALGTAYVQLKLYSAPNVPYPPGDYSLRARLRDDQGVDRGTATLALRLE